MYICEYCAGGGEYNYTRINLMKWELKYLSVFILLKKPLGYTKTFLKKVSKPTISQYTFVSKVYCEVPSKKFFLIPVYFSHKCHLSIFSLLLFSNTDKRIFKKKVNVFILKIS